MFNQIIQRSLIQSYKKLIIQSRMRSIRHRKLMEAARRMALQEPLHFEFTLTPESSCHCEAQVWQEEALRGLEKGRRVEELLLEFREWVQMPAEMMGKRSNEMALSKSGLYCLKNISSEDLQQLQLIFEDYLKFKTTQPSLLVPLLGVLSVHSSNGKSKWSDTFLLMPNLAEGQTTLFDLKGYCEGRLVEERDFKDFRFGKDQNFIKSQFLPMIEELPIGSRQHLFAIIQTNVQFLRERNLIDYSLVLAFRERRESHKKGESVFVLNDKYELDVHIIDFLQVYNQRKKLQNKFKSLFFKEISSVQPIAYANRLLQFMKKALLLK